jgi:hypothetical protein
LNARPALEDTFGMKPSLTRYRGGLAIGGPIVRDRTFYYAAAEQEQTHAQTASDIGQPTALAVNEILARGTLPKLGTQGLTPGVFPTGLTETELSGKVTHQLTPRHALMARLAATNRRESADAFNTGGLSDLSARGTSETRDIALTSTWTAIVGTRATRAARPACEPPCRPAHDGYTGTGRSHSGCRRIRASVRR